MSSDEDERLQNELALLETMYADRIAFDEHSRDFKFTGEAGAFLLRIPDGYLVDQVPDVLSASIGRTDCREQLRQQVRAMTLAEEILDAIVLAFADMIVQQGSGESEGALNNSQPAGIEPSGKATVVVWLHHLLNTNKRKQALSPASSAVSGVTKPGYPGILIYTGPSNAVREHVNELKTLNWQAFQVRLDTDTEWSLTHGHGVIEVESMKEVVAAVGEARKEMFMEAMRMK